MNSEIVEIFTDLVDTLNEKTTFKELSRKLKKKSYRGAAATAYSWIFDKILATRFSENIMNIEDEKNFRFFSPAETSSLGNDNINYLLKLFNLGFITKKELEQVLEQLKFFPDGEISKEHISWLVLTSFFEINNVTLPGSRLLLYSSDTIN
jgi:Uncharacterized protein conserved in bacteria